MKNKKELFNLFYAPVTRIIHRIWLMFFPKHYAKYLYFKVTHKKLNLDNPKDYNEKIEWLKLYSDTSEWTRCADKYKVRDYIKEKGLEHILVKLYGVWDKAEDIDFSKLPDKFVFKTNHAFGTVLLVKNKNNLDQEKTRKQLKMWLSKRYGLLSFEPHYYKIERKIIAEEYLEDNSNSKLSTSLIDYKFFCINGEPDAILVLADRPNLTDGINNNNSSSLKVRIYDSGWNVRDDINSGTLGDINGKIPKPKCFDEMLDICRVLSKPFPTVRVDLYEVNGKVYFGELTFTPGGHRNRFTQEYYKLMGEKIDISGVKRRKNRFVI